MSHLSNPRQPHLIRTFPKYPQENPTTEYLKAQLTLIRPPLDPVTMGQMLGNIGPLEILVVLIIALVVFGPKRLPELGNSLGKGIREFRDTVTGEKADDDDEDNDVKTLNAAQATTTTPVEQPAEPEIVHDKRS
jgi:sec-independent protein translocase protein TatA